jgi:hypothetical protein
VGEEAGEDRSVDAVPGVASEPTRGRAVTIEVNGQVFECRPDGRGGTDYDWVSGPNKGYGFTVSPTEGFSLDDHRESIRDFLDQIDPATGFIED